VYVNQALVTRWAKVVTSNSDYLFMSDMLRCTYRKKKNVE
jgi:hypothetical protein